MDRKDMNYTPDDHMNAMQSALHGLRQALAPSPEKQPEMLQQLSKEMPQVNRAGEEQNEPKAEQKQEAKQPQAEGLEYCDACHIMHKPGDHLNYPGK